jgi:hypothetical protein
MKDFLHMNNRSKKILYLQSFLTVVNFGLTIYMFITFPNFGKYYSIILFYFLSVFTTIILYTYNKKDVRDKKTMRIINKTNLVINILLIFSFLIYFLYVTERFLRTSY